MIYWYLFGGYVLISSMSVKSNNAVICYHGITGDGLKFTTCVPAGTGGFDDVVNFMGDIPYDVEVLTIKEVIRMSVDENSFLQFADLRELSMIRVYFVNADWMEKPPEYFHSIEKNVFKNTILEEISLVECTLNDSNVFTFPTYIKLLNLSSNQYTKLNLNEYEDLETVNVQSNFLEAFPIFSYPPPPLTYLNAGLNPLGNVTVHDVAALCWLKTLELSLQNSSLGKFVGFCECDRIVQWSMEIKLKIPELECYQPSDAEMSRMNCSSYNLQEARKIREKCIRTNTGISFIIRQMKKNAVNFLNFFLILSIISILAYVAFKLYKGTLSEATWKRKERRKPNFGTEEGEEEPHELKVNNPG